MERTSGRNRVRKLGGLALALLIASSLAHMQLQAQAPTLSKEYIRLGGRILAIEQAVPLGYAAPVYETWNYLTNSDNVAPYVLVGAGDFDRNGVPDLVYMNTTTSQVIVNYYGGTGGATLIGSAWLDEAGAPGWTVVAVADMNGDGVPDLIWQDNATAQVTVHYYGGVGGATDIGWNWMNQNNNSGWTVAGAADFDGNGTPDLVWQDQSTAQVTVHYYSYVGGVPTDTGWNWLDQAGASGWSVRAVADMNGDGVPDLIWEDNSTGQATVHFYGGAGGAVDEGWAWLRNGVSAPGWRIAAAADFNGDGTPDLVWQNYSSSSYPLWTVTVNYYGPG
ncbi:MAG: VCBS repeat-containing protein [Bryobacteraceae bacterium]